MNDLPELTEREHKSLLAELGCMVCRRLFGITDGGVQLHHRRSGGWGKGDYKTLIPLCPEHHQGKTGVHGMGTKGFERHYGFSQQDLLDDALELLAERRMLNVREMARAAARARPAAAAPGP